MTSHQTARTTTPLPPLAIKAWLRYDVVKRALDKLNPTTALEIGCGQGAFGARLAARSDYLGVEPDTSSFEVARARITAQGGKVMNGTSSEVPMTSGASGTSTSGSGSGTVGGTGIGGGTSGSGSMR